jgi:hypothetical protein
MPTQKGYGFARNNNEPLEEAFAGELRSLSGEYVSPKRQPTVLIVGPAEWSTDDLVFIKDYLAQFKVSATTYRPDGGLSVDDVITLLPHRNALVLITGEEPQSWGNIHRRRIQAAAEESGIRWRILPQSHPVGAADAASALVR